jgi:AcrR family transcriptional regulator
MSSAYLLDGFGFHPHLMIKQKASVCLFIVFIVTRTQPGGRLILPLDKKNIHTVCLYIGRRREMRRTKEDAAQTRAILLEAALKCFQEKGYVSTTLDDIAHKAGTTRGAIHWHFGNKAQLFNTLVRERYELAATIFHEALAPDQSPVQQLRGFLTSWITYAEENSDFRALLELLQLKTELVPELAEGMQEKVQGLRASRAMLAALIQRGITAGEIRPEVDAQMAALAALGMANGITTLWLMDSTAIQLKKAAQESVDLFLRGLGKA